MSVPVQGDCKYEPVPANDQHFDDSGHKPDESWKPFLRQMLVSSAVWSQYFQFGLVLGAPTVIIPQMRAEHGQEYISQEMASWISSANIISSIPWPLVVVILVFYIGRRYTFAIGTLVTLVGFAVLVASDSPLNVLIGNITQGPLSGLDMTVTLLVLTEYSSPQYRGVFLTIKSATTFWGIWVANVIGTFTHWKYIPALGLLCGAYNAVTLIAWPESPYWLIQKGRIDEGIKSHRWLKGNSESSEKELKEIINRQREECTIKYQDPENRSDEKHMTKWCEIWMSIKSKVFYKPLLINFALLFQYQLSGKLVFTIYAIDIIKGITHSTSEAYKGMLILDGVTLLGMYGGCYLSKKLTRRVLFFSTGGFTMLFLFIISLYLYLARLELITSNNIVTICLLTSYSISISCGPMIMSSTLVAELLPLKFRGASAAILAMVNYVILGLVLKMAPLMFSYIGMHGAFLFYGISFSLFYLLLYVYLPETKDKSLEEIKEMFVNTKN